MSLLSIVSSVLTIRDDFSQSAFGQRFLLKEWNPRGQSQCHAFVDSSDFGFKSSPRCEWFRRLHLCCWCKQCSISSRLLCQTRLQMQSFLPFHRVLPLRWPYLPLGSKIVMRRNKGRFGQSLTRKVGADDDDDEKNSPLKAIVDSKSVD